MTVNRRWALLLQLLVIVAWIGPGFAQETKYIFHIPWACSILHTNGDLIGAGAIIEEDKVLVSVDNFNGTVAGSNPPKRYYEVIDEVYVHAGSNFMDPSKVGRNPPFAQTQKAVKFYVAFKSPEQSPSSGSWDIKTNPTEISPKAGAEYDARGLTFNVGILVLSKPFSRSTYVMPMLIKGPDLPLRTRQFKRKLETSQVQTYSCITYSWNRERNRIRYHEVTYLPEANCLEVFCDWDLFNCGLFPKKSHLLCFKSVKFADVCPNARGAALYCPGFNNSVLAILTTAPACGQRHMPGVYTSLPLVAEFFEAAFKSDVQLDKRVPYDLFSLAQKNADYPGVL